MKSAQPAGESRRITAMSPDSPRAQAVQVNSVPATESACKPVPLEAVTASEPSCGPVQLASISALPACQAGLAAPPGRPTCPKAQFVGPEVMPRCCSNADASLFQSSHPFLSFNPFSVLADQCDKCPQEMSLGENESQAEIFVGPNPQPKLKSPPVSDSGLGFVL